MKSVMETKIPTKHVFLGSKNMIMLQKSLFVGNFLLKAVVDMTIQWEKTMSGPSRIYSGVVQCAPHNLGLKHDVPRSIRVSCLTCVFSFVSPLISPPTRKP